MTAIDWLEHHHANGDDSQGIENIILWLGANNALGTVTDLNIIATNDPTRSYHPDMSHTQRHEFNLWAPSHFRDDYSRLLDCVDGALSKKATNDWRVFVGTVPAVTIVPLAKGVGDAAFREDPFGVLERAKYFKYYTYFLFDEAHARVSEHKITREQAYTIDRYIAAYNQTIVELGAKKNRKYKVPRYHVVNVNKALLQAAYKRNDENPTYDFPEAMRDRFPMVDTRFYHATTRGAVVQGELFSLDGVHPSAIGQGLVAHEFLKVINKVRKSHFTVDWDAVYETDDLYMKPIRLMMWVRKQDEFAKLFLNLFRGSSRKQN